MLALTPDIYLPVLLGEPIGRDRKLTCPFHDDSTPSLHAYPDHRYCFGCRRGGTIYSLVSDERAVAGSPLARRGTNALYVSQYADRWASRPRTPCLRGSAPSLMPTKTKQATSARWRSTDEIHRRLRTEIVEGVLRPNERLIETELADRLGVSRTPIREALQRLASEGLIRARLRGWVVHEHSADEIREIYEARIALEGYATYLAALRSDDAALERIAAIHEESLAVAKGGHLRDRLVDLNARFHEAVFAAGANARLTELISQNRDFYFNHRIASVYTDAEMVASIDSQQAVVDAVLKRDAAAAEAAARRHVEQALAVMLLKTR